MFPRVILSEAGHRDGASKDPQQGAQKLLEPAQEQAEVVAGGGEDRVDAVTMSAFEVVATHPMAVLEMADHGLDGGAASHLAADGLGDPADLSADPYLEPVGIVVAAIALVAVDAAYRDTCELFEIGDDGTERVAVIGVAVQRLGVQHELPALGCGGGRGNRDLAAELVGSPRLALADALHLGRVQRVDLGSTLTLLLMAHTRCEIE